MSFEELLQDAGELSRFLGEATRPRVRNVLLQAKAEVEKEIVNLEMKQRIAAEKKAVGATPRRYLVELNEYAWDQSDKFVKLFVTLEGVQNIDESNVVATFNENSMVLHVSDLNGKDYGLTINNLLDSINVEKSYRKVKQGMVAIYMKKNNEGKHWDHLTTIQKRLKQKLDDEFKSSDDGNPENALVNIMKKMYNSGDSKTKQMIAKAWTEGQQKAHLGQEPEM
ncbi:calcyclin-binding protein [Bactrocera neohumeralis]|uniref:Calcyclin-binding protein n=1 Tax=Bactrocera dorsalis TaxID=27457 RepID=A0A034VKJ9_BACDO|nr:calcyclin-binding protein [Bactrocera dorsalis]XP_039962192.1 calcyclin-binding protein [Bactrocera tryoni]XP_049312469.1 calcyclin-binding protein [Bactrocera dorsalis]XP_049312470.1 calcyclin-binding protein [Bactrocera dorsalis]XP_049312471.1 calcyclin-binding protein [Bactrocera dorsalis]XP_050330717.1 calcyclin-binding protein [Bactrocera neohumeralis]